MHTNLSTSSTLSDSYIKLHIRTKEKGKFQAVEQGSLQRLQPKQLRQFSRARALPIGSPYGFTPIDWELVSRRKKKKDVLYVVLGCKFKSSHYDTTELRKSVRNMFELAVQRYNKENSGESISLEFVALHAGYGEHLFNAIARDIISSDIAVFETSDSLPNVFIEVGVALTWGSRVFLVKKQGCSAPPSDISGHTYADYLDNAATFVDPEHEEKLYTMVEHAIRKKV